VTGAVAMALSAARDRLYSRHGPTVADRRGAGKAQEVAPRVEASSGTPRGVVPV
jgi:hypothetical protein